jgi:hypothetical protein
MRLALALCSGLILVGCSKIRMIGSSTTQASPVSVVSSASTGSSQKLTATFHDRNGGSHIKEVTVSVMSDKAVPGGKSRWSSNECLLRYDIATNAIWMVPDSGGTWGSHPIIAGSSSSFSNSQCTVMASGSSAHVLENTVTVTVEVMFTPHFAGLKHLYLGCADVNGNWSTNYQQQFGTLMVEAPRAP